MNTHILLTRISRRFSSGLAVGLLLLTAVAASAADAVTRWNQRMCDFSAALPPPGLPPFLEVRAYAMAHLAMLNGLQDAGRHANANADAALAAAARGVLTHEFPMGAPAFESAYAAELALIAPGEARDAGVALGENAARKMLAERRNDEPFAWLETPYTPGSGPGAYQPTPPINFVAGYGWRQMAPFGLKSSAQFRAPIPYASLSSLEYAMDLNEIKVLGSDTVIGGARTSDQTALALYWYENSSFAWNRIARTLAASQELSQLEHARFFAALNVALIDAYLSSLESKFHYNFWRPITAIHAADTDGNPLTVGDPTWQPLFITPPVPDYPSAHAAAGGAAEVVIQAYLGANQAFAHTSTSWGAPRNFANVSAAATENAYSRMLVGIHFRAACTAGLEQGRAVGRYIVEKSAYARSSFVP